MKRQAVISSTVAPVYVEPVFSSEMITQALIWENVQVLEIDGNWYQIRMEDMYDGWIHSFYLHHRDPAVDQYTFITKRAVPIFQEMDKNLSGTWLTNIWEFEKLDEDFPGKVYLIYGNQRLAYFTSMKNRDNVVYNFSNMKLPIIR